MVSDLTSADSNEARFRTVERCPEEVTYRGGRRKIPRRARVPHDDRDVGIPIAIIIYGT
jgi:hypothetical protein